MDNWGEGVKYICTYMYAICIQCIYMLNRIFSYYKIIQEGADLSQAFLHPPSERNPEKHVKK